MARMTHNFSLRLTPDQRERLDALARATDRDAGAVLRWLLDATTLGTVPVLEIDWRAMAEREAEG